ncbi:ABC transporter permease [Amycolatopsis benzoatilytica]|uniref:ABC transporter permease n=1 Tax=Amycolatopsis benzoatilytica TaxID=346045 RepID=UPI0003A732C5|nr:ABC transporter permease [Amycolatopsis benzoatilytica]
MIQQALSPPAVRTGLRGEVRGLRVVWQRELIRFGRNRLRMVASLAQPVLFLFVLGTGLTRLAAAGAGFDIRTFLFPGIVAMTVMFTAIFSAVSIVWDREFGFLREMLVAPVSRPALVLGKILGGATVATLQGMLMLSLAGAVRVPYRPALLLELTGEMALAAVMVTAIGVLLASAITQIEAFQAVLQFVAMPMFFLSGAMFPTAGLPAWLSVLTRIDPLTYAVDPMRRAVLSRLALPHQVLAQLAPGVTWGSWTLGTGSELALVAVVSAVAAAGAVARFQRAV